MQEWVLSNILIEKPNVRIIFRQAFGSKFYSLLPISIMPKEGMLEDITKENEYHIFPLGLLLYAIKNDCQLLPNVKEMY